MAYDILQLNDFLLPELIDIADKMGYSSVAHLSAQFKKITGMPPSQFKNMGANQRKGLDEVGR
jgi:AraC-like DNA-binding protein